MKLERNVTVFDTYRPFFYWIWRRVSETNMRRTFRQGKQQKTRKLHLFLLFFFFCNSYRGLRKNNRDREVPNAS